MKLVSKEKLSVKKIEKQEVKPEVINEDIKSPAVIEEMFSVKEIENKISQSIDAIADKVVDKIISKFMKDDELMDTMSESILKKVTIKMEKSK